MTIADNLQGSKSSKVLKKSLGRALPVRPIEAVSNAFCGAFVEGILGGLAGLRGSKIQYVAPPVSESQEGPKGYGLREWK